MSEIPEDVLIAARKAATEVWVMAGLIPRSETSLGFADETTGVQIAIRAIMAERERCAYLARNACLVPPDGGSPTEAEAAVCDEAARRIMGNFSGHPQPSKKGVVE